MLYEVQHVCSEQTLHPERELLHSFSKRLAKNFLLDIPLKSQGTPVFSSYERHPATSSDIHPL